MSNAPARPRGTCSVCGGSVWTVTTKVCRKCLDAARRARADVKPVTVVSACQHHWMCPSPDGPIARSVCRDCGLVRDFSNTPAEGMSIVMGGKQPGTDARTFVAPLARRAR